MARGARGDVNTCDSVHACVVIQVDMILRCVAPEVRSVR